MFKSNVVELTTPFFESPETVVNAPQKNVLKTIVDQKWTEIDAAKQRTPLAALERQLPQAPAVRGFVAALRQASGMGLIAEIKKASPSAGLIRPDFDPVLLARIYEQHGANCLSVLTDEHFFQGSLDYLRQVRQAVSLPVLRKDFILDRYQVVEARVAGADCILLIAECLDDCRLRELYFHATDLGMDVLIEIYDPENLERVLKLDPPLLGVNNRDLRSMVTSLDQTLRLAPQVPPTTILVSESGIKTNADVRRLQQAGVKAMLVGESLMRSPDLGAAVDSLLGRSS